MSNERDDNYERIIHLVADRLNVPPDQIEDRLSFIKDRDVDSLDVEELALELEEEFGGESNSERDQASDYEPLPDSRPPLWYALFAVAVAATGVLIFIVIVGSCLERQ